MAEPQKSYRARVEVKRVYEVALPADSQAEATQHLRHLDPNDFEDIYIVGDRFSAFLGPDGETEASATLVQDRVLDFGFVREVQAGQAQAQGVA